MSDGEPDGWRVVIDGSPNLSRNLRFEQVNVRDDAGLWATVDGLTNDVFTRTPAPDLAAHKSADATAALQAVVGESLKDKQRRNRADFVEVGVGGAFGEDFVV